MVLEDESFKRFELPNLQSNIYIVFKYVTVKLTLSLRRLILWNPDIAN